MNHMNLIAGEGRGGASRFDTAQAIENAVDEAMRRGYKVGRRVAIGSIPGEIIGYNISRHGRYIGSRYPLIVETDYGIAKCHPDELRSL